MIAAALRRAAGRLHRAWRRHCLQVRIQQLLALRARYDWWDMPYDLATRHVEAQLAEARCELYSLQLIDGVA